MDRKKQGKDKIYLFPVSLYYHKNGKISRVVMPEE